MRRPKCAESVGFPLLLLLFSLSSVRSDVIFTSERCDRVLFGLQAVHGDPSRYRQCGPSGRVWIVPCAPGMTFHPEDRVCKDRTVETRLVKPMRRLETPRSTTGATPRTEEEFVFSTVRPKRPRPRNRTKPSEVKTAKLTLKPRTKIRKTTVAPMTLATSEMTPTSAPLIGIVFPPSYTEMPEMPDTPDTTYRPAFTPPGHRIRQTTIPPVTHATQFVPWPEHRTRTTLQPSEGHPETLPPYSVDRNEVADGEDATTIQPEYTVRYNGQSMTEQEFLNQLLNIVQHQKAVNEREQREKFEMMEKDRLRQEAEELAQGRVRALQKMEEERRRLEAMQQEHRQKVAEESKRLAMIKEERQRLAEEENQKQEMIKEELQRAEEDRQRQVLLEEERKRKAEEERRRQELAKEEQRRVEEERRRLAMVEEERRLKAEKERKRAKIIAQERKKSEEARKRLEELEEERRRKAAEEDERLRKAERERQARMEAEQEELKRREWEDAMRKAQAEAELREAQQRAQAAAVAEQERTRQEQLTTRNVEIEQEAMRQMIERERFNQLGTAPPKAPIYMPALPEQGYAAQQATSSPLMPTPDVVEAQMIRFTTAEPEWVTSSNSWKPPTDWQNQGDMEDRHVVASAGPDEPRVLRGCLVNGDCPLSYEFDTLCPHPQDPSWYLQCAPLLGRHGRWTERQCPDTLEFIPELARCEKSFSNSIREPYNPENRVVIPRLPSETDYVQWQGNRVIETAPGSSPPRIYPPPPEPPTPSHPHIYNTIDQFPRDLLPHMPQATPATTAVDFYGRPIGGPDSLPPVPIVDFLSQQQQYLQQQQQQVQQQQNLHNQMRVANSIHQPYPQAGNNNFGNEIQASNTMPADMDLSRIHPLFPRVQPDFLKMLPRIRLALQHDVPGRHSSIGTIVKPVIKQIALDQTKMFLDKLLADQAARNSTIEPDRLRAEGAPQEAADGKKDKKE